MIVWALFDSGNGCYTQAAKKLEDLQIYPIGIDIESKNSHFINLNLVDYGRMFGDNPASSRIWHYINDILNFSISFDNLTYYSNYGYPIQKPTRFKSNINLNLKCDRNIKPNKSWDNFSKSYNERSNIPIDLILDIYNNVNKALTSNNLSQCQQRLF